MVKGWIGLFFLTVFSLSSSAQMISHGVQALAAPSKLLYDGEVLISADLIDNYKRVQAEREDMKVSDFIPTNMKPSRDSGYVMSVIADRSMNTILNQPQFRESSLGRTANKVEKSLNQEVTFGGDKAKNEIQHKLNFQVQAFQSQAQIKYEGFTNAAVLYRAVNSAVTFEVFDKLPTVRQQQVVLSHELRPDEKISRLSVRWDW